MLQTEIMYVRLLQLSLRYFISKNHIGLDVIVHATLSLRPVVFYASIPYRFHCLHDSSKVGVRDSSNSFL